MSPVIDCHVHGSTGLAMRAFREHLRETGTLEDGPHHLWASPAFEDPKRQELIGPLRLNMSGCINACGHHHSGNIGILGVDKKGAELYQISLGGSPKDDAAVGTIVGPGFRAEAVPQAIDTIIDTYLAKRSDGETFLDTWRRVGAQPFKEALYGAA